MIPESSISLRRGANGKWIMTTDNSQNEYPTLGAALDELKWLRNPAADSAHTTRESVLDAAKRCVCGDREQDYGSPENNFRTIASMWNSYLYGAGLMENHDPTVWKGIKPKDVAAMLALLKIARIASGHAKADNWSDLAGYAACGGELEANNY